MKRREKKIEKHLTWEPNSSKEINIEDDTFTITLKKDEVEIECDWDYGWGGSGVERMWIPLAELKALIKELEEA